MDNKLPKRKHPRLDNYDYSLSGAYFITICTLKRKCLLSSISSGYENVSAESAGQGLSSVAAKCTNTYTEFGKIALNQLMLLQERFPCVFLDKYVIMPNHIHIVLILNNGAAGIPRPTITDIICSFKSLTTRECKKAGMSGLLFQTSFYEHIIRNREDYEQIAKYIEENPINWYYDDLYSP